MPNVHHHLGFGKSLLQQVFGGVGVVHSDQDDLLQFTMSSNPMSAKTSTMQENCPGAQPSVPSSMCQVMKHLSLELLPSTTAYDMRSPTPANRSDKHEHNLCSELGATCCAQDSHVVPASVAHLLVHAQRPFPHILQVLLHITQAGAVDMPEAQHNTTSPTRNERAEVVPLHAFAQLVHMV